MAVHTPFDRVVAALADKEPDAPRISTPPAMSYSPSPPTLANSGAKSGAIISQRHIVST